MQTVNERKAFYDKWVSSAGALAHLRTTTSHRRKTYDLDFRDTDDPFIWDIRAILNAKGFRRLDKKNQVASLPRLPHVRDRATHVMEVNSQAIAIAMHLGLNVNLASAISFGHDIGHVPFGHQGEHYLGDRLGLPFTHEVMGTILCQQIERDGKGLNLTWHTLDGMWRRSGNNAVPEMSAEAWVVRYADKIAYLFSDYNDLVKRFRWKCPDELNDLAKWFGHNQRSRVTHVITELCLESATEGRVTFEKSEAAQNFSHFRKLMYQQYVGVVEQNIARILDPLWAYFEGSKIVPPWLGIALLTDVEVLHLINSAGHLINYGHIETTGLGEILKLVPQEKLFAIDPCGLDLDW